MANITALTNIKALASYLPDGVWGSVDALVDNLPVDVKLADNLTLFATAAITTTPVSVSTTANARPLLIIVQSTGTLCWVHLHNAAVGSVTAGVNVDFLIPVGGTSGEVSVLLCLGAGWSRFWVTGLTISASTATETSAAPTNAPNVWMVTY